jgi:hypothetical protein
MPPHFTRFRAAGLAVAMGLIVLGNPVHAADQSGRFVVRGSGADLCSSFSKAFDTKDNQAVERYASWIFGYASATSKLSSQTLDVSPSADGRDILAFVLNICQAKPAMSIEAASAQVFSGLAAIRPTVDGPVVKFSVDGKALSIREETVRFAERKLKVAGFYKDAEGGKATPQLIAAIKKYQTDQKLPNSGLPDIRTLLRLAAQK